MADSPDTVHPVATAPHYDRVRIAIAERYRIERQIGEGGMATVFLAEDLKHHRKVAIKVLQESLTHTIGIRRFLQEIDVIAQLQHPHLLTLIDSGEVEGLPYYVMPFIEAQSLRELITANTKLPIEHAVTIAREIADGLAYAHEHGIIHRDIKPSNILMSGGHAVVADFGIATALQKAAVGRITETGISLGSPTYMSPEQAAGERDLDARTDVYSLACVLYEMLTGELPIDNTSMQRMILQKLSGDVPLLRTRRPDAPAALEVAVHRALAAEREQRFASIQEFAAAITQAVAASGRVSRKTVWIGAAAAVVLLVAGGFWLRDQRRIVWATQQVGDINRMALAGQYASAFQLAEEVVPIIPGDSALRRIRPVFTDFIKIVTDPPGARVSRQRLGVTDTTWAMLGTTPLDSLAVPKSGRDLTYRLRIELDGYQTVEALPNIFASWFGIVGLDTLRLDRGADMAGMVRIPGFKLRDTLHRVGSRDSITFADYHIGKYEVTNREYARFVAAGGYQKREYWTEPFVRDGKTLAWEQGVAELRDRAGLPGPSTWSGGTYPPGQDDFPVGGVSYYEAAAYARFAGKRLPTSTHWLRAALRHNRDISWLVVPASNLNGAQPRRAGLGMLNAYAMYDVAGNVREWCVNLVDEGRLTRGAGWEDSDFHVGHLIPKPDFDRSPSNGFRLVSLSDHDTTIAHVAGRVLRAVPRDFSKVSTLSDAEFRFYRRLFDYDNRPLEVRRDTAGMAQHYRWEKVSFTASYGRERMVAYLLLPKDAEPPYEAVIWWPGSPAMTQRSFDPRNLSLETLTGFLPRSGRAVVFPLYKGSYERDDSTFSAVISVPDSTTYYRDLAVHWVKDFRRTVDYLATRGDIAADKLGFVGHSWGGEIGPVALALEPRIKAAVMLVGGYWPGNTPAPEVETHNYVPRVRTPILMLNGRHDIVFPYETSQLPFFRQLGTPAADKKHVVYNTSHTVPQDEFVRETLAWFDRYLSGKAAPR